MQLCAEMTKNYVHIEDDDDVEMDEELDGDDFGDDALVISLLIPPIPFPFFGPFCKQLATVATSFMSFFASLPLPLACTSRPGFPWPSYSRAPRDTSQAYTLASTQSSRGHFSSPLWAEPRHSHF